MFLFVYFCIYKSICICVVVCGAHACSQSKPIGGGNNVCFLFPFQIKMSLIKEDT